MELSEEQLKVAETQLKRYLPRSMMVYGLLMLRNRVPSDPIAVFVDRWPDFNVLISRPQCEQRADLFKDILIFANDGKILEETIRKSSVIDWSRYLCFGCSQQTAEILKAVASEKGVPGCQLALCHMMILEDVSNLPGVDSSRISLSSLNESHISLVNQTWKFGESEISISMIRNMVTNFPSCCVLDAKGKPVAWILVYGSCAMGMLYTLPEHRGKGYAKVLICSMAKRLHAEGYPVYCFIEEDNTVSYKIFKNLGFTEDPSYRGEWFDFNEL
ncbi:glycine N-acyltransferase-like [Cheilinus undulatus]|uniref:glycine N-acyltransferase-like n=1 Tax=Cheilinus undulatus TaxID=241271 RepID=UPI001BD69E3C|nr:glycine N-acyltransferase-like [Cheilinus undulatus]